MARPKGSRNKTTLSRIAQVATLNDFPLPRILHAMRIFEGLAARVGPTLPNGDANPRHDEKAFVTYVEKMMLAAEKAAPYLHSRLSAITHKFQGDLSSLSDEELLIVQRITRKLADRGADPNRVGPTAH